MATGTKRVLVLQHAVPEHLGLIAEALESMGASYDYCRPFVGDAVPQRLKGYQGLVLMGGPQSVYEEDRFPYLKAEMALARWAVEAGVPVLGVCLGSQILAEVLGATVRPSGGMELGWKEVRLSSDALQDPVLGGLPGRVPALHWHGDIYDLPPGTRPVGSSEMTEVQGFISGDSLAHGLLFHLEVTEEQVALMAQAFPEDLRRGGTDREALLAETREHAEVVREHGLLAFRRWAKLL